MAGHSRRASLIMSTLAVAVWAGASIQFGGQPVVATALIAPAFFAMIYFTMRISNRLTEGLLGRFGLGPPEPPTPPTPTEPSSDRPEHAQRRRRRRRPRGRGRRT